MGEAPAQDVGETLVFGSRSKALAAALLLGLSGCATAPATIAVSDRGERSSRVEAGAGEAILILAMAGPIGTSGQYELRQVDMASNAFTSAPIAVTYAIWGFGDIMRAGPRPDAGASGAAGAPAGPEIVLLIKKVPAGDYAVTGTFWSTAGLYSSGSVSGCFRDSAVVVRLPPGKVGIVSTGDVAPPAALGRLPASTDPARILQAFENARANYPNLEGEPVRAESIGRISWTPSDGWFGDPCYRGADRFATLQGSDARIEAARAAALEAARQNLLRAASPAGPLSAAPPNGGATSTPEEQR